MGNKQSGGPGPRANDPTCRSFSWQTEPCGVEAMPNPNISRRGSFTVSSGQSKPLTRAPPRCGSELGISTSQFDPSSLRRDFSSMQRNKSPPKHMENIPPEREKRGGEDKNSVTSPDSKKSRPGTSDSGYYGMDSDSKARSRHLRGSRLSLNEAVFNQGPGHMSPPPQFMMPPPMNMNMNMMPPLPPPPPMNDKDAKKWLKKQEKEQKKLQKHCKGRVEQPPPMMLPFPPPPGMSLPPFHQPPPMGPPMHRRSMDNLMGVGMVNTLPMGPVGGPPRMHGSQTDLRYGMPPPSKWSGSQSMVGQPPVATTNARIANPRVAEKTMQPSVKKSDSRVEGGSRRSKPATHFEEERPSIDQVSKNQIQFQNMKQDAVTVENTFNAADEAAIYETLNNKNRMIATAEISVDQWHNNVTNEHRDDNNHTGVNDVMVERVDLGEKQEASKEDSTKLLPVKISATAQEILDRNALLFGQSSTEVEQESQVNESNSTNNEMPKKIEGMQQKILQEMQEEQERVDSDGRESPSCSLSSADSSGNAGEEHISQTIHPTLPRHKHVKPRHFEPLTAWNDIDVADQVKLRQPDRSRPVPVCIEERMNVKLVAVAPSRSVDNEPIYNEFDGGLPDIKKRLIETGSFDVSDIEPRLNPMIASQSEGLSKSYPSGVSYPADQVSRSSDLLNMGEQRALLKTNIPPTPSIRPPPADSEIDFSWVDDLESKFRGEFAQYDQQREEVNQRSLRRGMNPTSIYYTNNNRPDPQFVPNVSSDQQARYFGIYDSPMALNTSSYQVTNEPQNVVTREEELSQLDSQVRLKKAMFEQEAQRVVKANEVRRLSPTCRSKSTSSVHRNGIDNGHSHIQNGHPIPIVQNGHSNVHSRQFNGQNGHSNGQNGHSNVHGGQFNGQNGHTITHTVSYSNGNGNGPSQINGVVSPGHVSKEFVDSSPYIPVPDYDRPVSGPSKDMVYCPEIGGPAPRPSSRRTPTQSPRLRSSRSTERLNNVGNSGNVGGWRYEQLSVDTNRNGHSPGRLPMRHMSQDRLPVPTMSRISHESPRSPSERRIHRMEMNRQQENHWSPVYTSRPNGTVDQLQKGRKYDSTEYYRQNVMPDNKRKPPSARSKQPPPSQYASQPVFNNCKGGPRPYQQPLPVYRPVTFAPSKH